MGANITTSIQQSPVLCDLSSELPSMGAIDKFDCVQLNNISVIGESHALFILMKHWIDLEKGINDITGCKIQNFLAPTKLAIPF